MAQYNGSFDDFQAQLDQEFLERMDRIKNSPEFPTLAKGFEIMNADGAYRRFGAGPRMVSGPALDRLFLSSVVLTERNIDAMLGCGTPLTPEEKDLLADLTEKRHDLEALISLLLPPWYEPIPYADDVMGPMRFDGDILITDPCYVAKDEDWDTFPNDFPLVGLQASTRYGDWGCHVFDNTTKKPIGQFCADAGMVCVYHLNDALTYNPEKVVELLTKDWCATVVKDFHGTVDIRYHEDIDEVRVHGEGEAEGKPLSFESHQTGL